MKRSDPSSAAWRTSSYSGQNGDCVEVAPSVPDVVAVRDSKDREGPVLAFGPDEWRAFTAQVRMPGLALHGDDRGEWAREGC